MPCDSRYTPGLNCSGNGVCLEGGLCLCRDGFANLADMTFVPRSCDFQEDAISALWAFAFLTFVPSVLLAGRHFVIGVRRSGARAALNLRRPTTLIQTLILLDSVLWMIIAAMHFPRPAMYIGRDLAASWLFLVAALVLYFTAWRYSHLYTVMSIKQNHLQGRHSANRVLRYTPIVGGLLMTTNVVGATFILVGNYDLAHSVTYVRLFFYLNGVAILFGLMLFPLAIRAIVFDLEAVVGTTKTSSEPSSPATKRAHSTIGAANAERLRELLLWLKILTRVIFVIIFAITVMAFIFGSIPALYEVAIAYQCPLIVASAGVVFSVYSRSISTFVVGNRRNRKTQKSSNRTGMKAGDDNNNNNANDKEAVVAAAAAGPPPE